MSFHSAACLNAVKAFEREHRSVSVVNSTLNFIDFINTVQLNFIKEHAEEIMKAFSIRYVKDVKFAVVSSTIRILAGLCQVLRLTFESIILNHLKP